MRALKNSIRRSTIGPPRGGAPEDTPLRRALGIRYHRGRARPPAPGGGDTVKYFGPEALAFFRGLKKNNTKVWFEAHRDDYEQHVRGPLTGLVREMDSRFSDFAP